MPGGLSRLRKYFEFSFCGSFLKTDAQLFKNLRDSRINRHVEQPADCDFYINQNRRNDAEPSTGPCCTVAEVFLAVPIGGAG